MFHYSMACFVQMGGNISAVEVVYHLNSERRQIKLNEVPIRCVWYYGIAAQAVSLDDFLTSGYLQMSLRHEDTAKQILRRE